MKCRVKTQYLPQISYPYVAEMGFYREIQNIDGKLKKKKFKGETIFSPFYFLLKIKDIENSGKIVICFYESTKEEKLKKPKVNRHKKVEKIFPYGEDGKYYEYVIFFDQVDGLPPGKHHFAIFYSQKLIYESHVTITKESL